MISDDLFDLNPYLLEIINMARRNRTDDSTNDADDNLPTAGAGSIPSHEHAIMGVANIIGDFNLSDGVTGPSAIVRRVRPYAAYVQGYSETDGDGVSVGDVNAMLDKTIDADQDLYPVTMYARAFEREAAPVLLSIFEAGLTYNSAPSVTALTRYPAAVLETYQTLYSLQVLNHLTYHADWSGYYPYNGIVPAWLYDLCDLFDCDDVGMAKNYLPYARRLETHTCFPNMIMESKELLTPMLSMDVNGRLFIPTFLNLFEGDSYEEGEDPGMAIARIRNSRNWTDVTVKNRLKDRFDLLDTVLVNARKAYMAYVPFPLAKMDLWTVPEPRINPYILSGWYNSGVKRFDTFNDTGDPEPHEVMVCDNSEDNSATFYSIAPQPTWGEVKYSTIFSLDVERFDDTYYLLTPHQWNNIALFDNYNQVSFYNGQVVGISDNRFELHNFPRCRYVISHENVRHGLQEPGYLHAKLHRTDIRRLVTLEVLANVHYDQMKAIRGLMTGSSVRVIRKETAEIASLHR